MPRTKLEVSDITAIVDTREQLPWSLAPLQVESGTLATGDYSVKGLERVIAIERKSLGDLLGCIGGGRERFEDCIQRMLGYPCRAVIVECTWTEFKSGGWRSRVTPSSAIGSVLGWMGRGIPFLFAGDANAASTECARLMFIEARRRWDESRTFRESLKIADKD